MLSAGGEGVSCGASAERSGFTATEDEDEPEPEYTAIVKTEKSDKDKLNVAESRVVTATKVVPSKKSRGTTTPKTGARDTTTKKKPPVSEGRTAGTKRSVQDCDEYDAEGEEDSVKIAHGKKNNAVELAEQFNTVTEKVKRLYALYNVEAGKNGVGPLPPLKYTITDRPEYAKELAAYKAGMAAGKAPKSHAPP